MMDDTFEINEKEHSILIALNPRIYQLSVVMAASYVFLDKAYVLIDGEPEEELIVELKPKKISAEQANDALNSLARSFLNELVHYSVYEMQSRRNAAVKRHLYDQAFRRYSLDKSSDKQVDASRGATKLSTERTASK